MSDQVSRLQIDLQQQEDDRWTVRTGITTPGKGTEWSDSAPPLPNIDVALASAALLCEMIRGPVRTRLAAEIDVVRAVIQERFEASS